MKELVSIVINNYNYERFLAQAIESALAQTYPNCEVIVVDDGSIDGSRVLIESYGEQVRTIFKQNGGQASAFNVGIEASTGKYIILLDSDDFLDIGAVAKCIDIWDENAVRLCFGLREVNACGNCLGKRVISGDEAFILDVNEVIYQKNFFPGTVTSGNFFKGVALKECLPIPVDKYRISADLYIFCRLAELGPVQFTPEILSNYRIHSSNNYTSNSGRFLRTSRQLENTLDNYLNKRELLCTYAIHLNSTAPNHFDRFWSTPDCLSIISDAKVLGVKDSRLNEWSACKIIKVATNNLLRTGLFSLKPWGLFFFLVLVEVSPRKMAIAYHKIIRRVIKSFEFSN
jgi:glycosyltransferase involved in cell wall biosynthesis